MKKVLLSAIMCFAMTSMAFAEGSEKETKKNEPAAKESSECTDNEDVLPCGFTIFIRNVRNEVVKTISYNGTAPTAKSCCEWADSQVAAQSNMLNPMSGYTATHDLPCR